ncbi:MAG: hypothetical protein NC489_19795 [Ruminococcus flavefaciens]|nr:hypothetical protein [Ruminococcus flavefaciens]
MGISRYNSEGYADPTAYEALRSIDVFRVDHPTGYIEVNIDTFFPCTVAKGKKLFKLIRANCSKRQQDELLLALVRKAKSCAEEAMKLEGSLDEVPCDPAEYKRRLRQFKALTRQHSQLARNIQDLTAGR